MRAGSVTLPAALALALGACAAAGRSDTGDARPAPADEAAFVRVVAPFTVLDETGSPYDHPFLGGFDVPRPQFVDIDGDGDLDLFVQERSNQLIFFENTGRAGAPSFTWRTDRYRGLEIGEWYRFADLDGDGDPDLLAEEPYSYIRYYRNQGTTRAPEFVLAADSLRDVDGKAVFSDRQNIPNIADIDCDGLPDLFIGRVEGTLMRYEAAGPDGGAVPRFRLVTPRFEGIEIVAQIGSLHGANTMYFADVDADGDLDLFWGDFFEPGVLLIRNTGTCSAPSLRGEPVPLRVDGEVLTTSGFNAPALADLDADGDLDIFLGVLGGAFNPNRTAADNFYYAERLADGGLTLRTRRFISGIDVGSESVPALADLDGDGDLDLLVGNKIDPTALDRSRLFLFENTGTATAPAFRLADTLDLAPTYHFAPAFADLDGDGDLDLLLGTWNKGVRYFLNDGTASEPHFVELGSRAIELTRGSNATPALVDIDGDGDLDLFVGEASGEVNFYRNTGSAREPRFTLETDRFEEIDVGRRSHPAFVDIDGDGDLDLVLGREAGGAVLYRNDGTPTAPSFVEDPSFTLPLPPVGAPVFGDLNGDRRPELVAGDLSGGVVYFENRGGTR